MFDDLFNVTSQQMGRFAGTVRDQFGQSILTEVFEPVLHEISSLQQVNELFRTRAVEIEQQMAELRSFGNLP